MNGSLSAASRQWWLCLSSAVALIIPLSLPVSAAAVADIEMNTLSGVYLAARIAESEKDFAAAAAFYRSAHENDPENLVLLERALVLTAAEGEIEAAVKLADKLVESNQDNRIGRLLLAVHALRGKTYSAAIAELDKSARGALVELSSALISAWAKVGQGDVDGALETIDGLKGEEWFESFKLLHGGLIAGADKRWEDALSRLSRAQEREPNAIRITEAYVRTLDNAGKRDRAIAVIEAYLVKNPQNSAARHLSRELGSDRSLDLMITNAQQGAAELLSGLGSAIGQDDSPELSVLYLRMALYLDPAGSDGLTGISLGETLARHDQAEAAIGVFKAVPDTAPYRALALVRAALALDQLDRIEESVSAFDGAIADMPDDPQIYIIYGNMLRGRKMFKEASGVYTSAIDLLSKPTRAHWTWYYFRGIAHERTKQWPLAEADFQQALKLYPDQPLVLNYLGYSWVDMGLNLDEALGMIKKAVELRPDDGYIVDSLGWVYYRLGRFEDAVGELERAVTLRPEDPVINDHLGDAYWKVGRTLEAQFQWRHARDLGAEKPELDLITRKIEEGRLIEKDLEAPMKKTDAGNGTPGLPLAPTSAAANQSRPATSRNDFYVVREGQSLWQIAVDVFDDGFAYKQIFDANRDQLPDANAIRPGMRLRIPQGL